MLDWKRIQRALKAKGFDPGAIDGIPGPRTDAAIIAFKRSIGYAARPYLGPLTLQALLGGGEGDAVAAKDALSLPWMNEAAKYMGLHERNHFSQLVAFLRADKRSVGDPRKLPWCGDFIETAIKLALPNEPFPGAVGANPYLARNWLHFGKDVGPAFGAVVVFWRTHKTQSLNGHVGFAIGRDPKRGLIRVRGGNQGNAVTDTWIEESRLLGYRWPVSYDGPVVPLPTMNSAGAIVSRNEQ